MPAPRIAKSLDVLRTAANKAAPKRSKASDGWIGDPAHAARKSDHNPNKAGVVQALDLTHDLKGGLDSYWLAEQLRLSKDPRIKNVISNGRIFAGPKGPSPWVWRPYKGSNKHAHHVHISVRDEASLYDNAVAWPIPWLGSKPAPAPVVKPAPIPAPVQRPEPVVVAPKPTPQPQPVKPEPEGFWGWARFLLGF